MNANRTLDAAIAEYLAARGAELSASTRRSYESGLRALSTAFPGRPLSDFGAPQATAMLKEFLDHRWGSAANSTWNGRLSVLQEFFLWHARQGNLDADRARVIQRKKEGRPSHQAFEGPWFDQAERDAVLRVNPDVRDRVPLRLVMDFGVRKGALRMLRFRDFDRGRRQVTFTTRGRRQVLPIPDSEFWEDFDQLRTNIAAREDQYILPKRTRRAFRPENAQKIDQLYGDLTSAADRATQLGGELQSTEAAISLLKLNEAVEFFDLARERAFTKARVYPSDPLGEHGAHDWWYECLRRAGLVERGVTRGRGMQKGRHSAGKRVLERTGGDIKQVAEMLGMQAGTARSTYVDTPVDSLDAAMKRVRRQLDTTDTPDE